MDDWDKLDAKLEALQNIADDIEHKAAPEICSMMRNYALDRLDAQVYDNNSRSVTGKLRNSVRGASDIIVRKNDAAVVMGIDSTAEYAKYVEFGTGPKGSAVYKGHLSEGVTFTSKERWGPYFNTQLGEFRMGFPQAPRPFMRPALYDQVEDFKQTIVDVISDVIG